MGKKKQAEEPQAVAEAVDELVAVIDDVDVSAAIAEDDQARELSGQMDGYPDGLRSLKGVGQKTVDAWEDQMVEWLSVHSRESQAAEAAESDGE